jgi:GT2 family glycosyltransferase
LPNLPRASIIVPVYNAATTLEECITSLLELDYPKDLLELIFVDNASTDTTRDLLRRYDGALRILFERKRGPAAARNKGLHHARGEAIAFTDSDCVVDKAWLQTIVAPLEDRTIGIVGGKILAKPPSSEIERFGEQIHDHSKAIEEYKPPYVITMNWASRLSVLQEAGLFDEIFLRAEDVDLSYRIFQRGYKIVYQPEALIHHANEKTYFGLFQEGYMHGFASVQALKKHMALAARYGHRRVNLASYREIFSDLVGVLRGQAEEKKRCSLFFNSGKKAGKLVGSLRFAYLDL